MPLPAIVWWNTAVLIASSITLELARHKATAPQLTLTLALGAHFDRPVASMARAAAHRRVRGHPRRVLPCSPACGLLG
ncbi:MAG: hypothetical protein U1E76_03885 [Planctomycetota bacterium]